VCRSRKSIVELAHDLIEVALTARVVRGLTNAIYELLELRFGERLPIAIA
jgi:hypothetical protein